jgi:hypothetical protein
MRGGLEVRHGVMGKPAVGGGHAVLEAVARKGYLPRPPAFSGAVPAKAKNQGLQFFVAKLHCIGSRNKVLGHRELQRRHRRGLCLRASVRRRHQPSSASLVEIEKGERPRTRRACRLASRRERTDWSGIPGRAGVRNLRNALRHGREPLAGFPYPIARPALHSDRRSGHKARAIRELNESHEHGQVRWCARSRE